MNQKVELRQEIKSDHPAVFEVHQIAFGQENEAGMVDALRKNKSVFIPELSIVATIENKVIGHILFSRIHIRNDKGELHESLALAPMAVRPEWHKQGIGSQLVRKGLEVAKDLGYKSVIVLGHEHYYPKFGFQPAEKWKITAPFEVPSNVFMAIELTSGGLDGISGTVIYPKEFDTV